MKFKFGIQRSRDLNAGATLPLPDLARASFGVSAGVALSFEHISADTVGAGKNDEERFGGRNTDKEELEQAPSLLAADVASGKSSTLLRRHGSRSQFCRVHPLQDSEPRRCSA